MTPKCLVLILFVALLVPVASSMASPGGPSPAPAASPAWLGGPGCAAKATVTPILGDEGAPAALPATPFGQRQDKSGFCAPGACDEYCNNVCAPCGGYPYSQCLQNVTGSGCHAICWCYIC